MFFDTCFLGRTTVFSTKFEQFFRNMYKTASSLRNENYENENTSITSTKAIRHFNFNNIFPSS